MFEGKSFSTVFSTPALVVKARKSVAKEKTVVTVSKKIDKRSVVRNKIKRRLKAYIKEAGTMKKDYLIIVRKNILDRDKKEIVDSLKKGLSGN